MLILAGDSHAIALREALPLLDDQLKGALDSAFGTVCAGMVDTAGRLKYPFHALEDGRIVFPDENIRKRFDAIAGQLLIFDRNFRGIVGLAAGHYFKAHMKRRLWNRYSVVPNGKKHFVTAAALGELMDKHDRGVRRFAGDLVALGIRCFFLGPPPIRQEFAGRLKIPPCEAFGLHAAMCEWWRQFAETLAIPVVAAPARVIEGGVLKAEYEPEGDDVHHANALYGIEMWREILDKAPLIKRCRP